MSEDQKAEYDARIAEMTDQELRKEVAHNSYEAAMKSTFRQDSAVEDDRCGCLYQLCVERGTLDTVYTPGWEDGAGTLTSE